jgi:hypothetical protein
MSDEPVMSDAWSVMTGERGSTAGSVLVYFTSGFAPGRRSRWLALRFLAHHSSLIASFLAMALLTPLDVARRIASVIGIVVLIALALTLLWRVYVHHRQNDPYEREGPVTVSLDEHGSTFVKIADYLG